MKVADLLRLPESLTIDELDLPAAVYRHRQIIQKKPFLRRLYQDFYREFRRHLDEDIRPLTCVEIGSGGGFIKEVLADVITSDIMPVRLVDVVFSAQNLPLKDNSVDAFLMLNVFHHLHSPIGGLREIQRCLRGNGKVIMIEPANTWWRRFIDEKFHHEIFDIHASWDFQGEAPLSEANSALPWIIFCRDRQIFEKMFPALRIKKIQYHTPFRYMLSGGVAYRSLLPCFLYPVAKGIDQMFGPLSSFFGYFQTIVLEKND